MIFSMARLTQRRFLTFHVATALLLSTARAEHFDTAISPVVQDGLVNTAPTTCPVAQDGYTSNTFPWTHNPTCVDAVLPSSDDTDLDIHQTFCTYTNARYNNGRGVSFVATPETAASVTSETFGLGIGGLEGQVGEEMGMWEVKETESKGLGLFVKKDVAAIFAGESVIVKTPVLFVSEALLQTPSTPGRETLLSSAVEQLPAQTRDMVLSLDRSGDSIQDMISTNGIAVKWPWVDDVPKLLAVVPEVAVSIALDPVEDD